MCAGGGGDWRLGLNGGKGGGSRRPRDGSGKERFIAVEETALLLGAAGAARPDAALALAPQKRGPHGRVGPRKVTQGGETRVGVRRGGESIKPAVEIGPYGLMEALREPLRHQAAVVGDHRGAVARVDSQQPHSAPRDGERRQDDGEQIGA